MRLFGVRMPGMTPPTPRSRWRARRGPAARTAAQKGDRNLAATLAGLQATASACSAGPTSRALDVARRDAEAWLATMPDLDDGLRRGAARVGPHLPAPPRGEHAAPARVEHARRGAPRASSSSSWNDAGGDPRAWSTASSAGTGDVDSAQPARRLWALGRLVARDRELTAAFDAGLDGIAERTRGTALEAGIEAFLRDHGHRGNDEYELASPAWVMDPRPVYASIDRLRHVPDDRDPGVHGARGSGPTPTPRSPRRSASSPRPLRRIVRRAATVARLGGDRARASQGHPRAREPRRSAGAPRAGAPGGRARRTRRPPARRSASRSTSSRLRRVAAATSTDVIAERAAQERYLNDRVPPSWFDGQHPGSVHVAAPRGRARRRPRRRGPRCHGHRGERRPGIGTRPGSSIDPGRPAWPRARRGARVRHHRPVVDAAVPRRGRGGVRHRRHAEPRRHRRPRARHTGRDERPRHHAVADGTVLHVDGDRGTVRIG